MYCNSYNCKNLHSLHSYTVHHSLTQFNNIWQKNGIVRQRKWYDNLIKNYSHKSNMSAVKVMSHNDIRFQNCFQIIFLFTESIDIFGKIKCTPYAENLPERNVMSLSFFSVTSMRHWNNLRTIAVICLALVSSYLASSPFHITLG